MKGKARPLAYGALSAAAGVLLLFLSSVLPNGRLAVLCIATLCVAFVRMMSGWRWALGCYAVTAALSLLLLPSKVMPILYAAFFGYYPVVKLGAEHFASRAVRWGIKLAAFNGVMAILYFTVRALFQGDWGMLSRTPALMLLCANIAFVLYDLALTQGILFYIRKIARRID